MLAERDAAILRLFQAKTLVTARIEPEAGSSPAARNPSLGPVVAMQRNELTSGGRSEYRRSGCTRWYQVKCPLSQAERFEGPGEHRRVPSYSTF